MTVEDDRAAEYRRMMVARARYAVVSERALAGSKAARVALDVRVAPLLTECDADGVPRLGFEDRC